MPVVAHDHTRLVSRENKVWTFNDIRLPRGIVMPRAAAGAVAGLLVFGISAAVIGVAGASPAVYIAGFVAAVVSGIGVYLIPGRYNKDHLRILHAPLVWLDWWKQPRRISGFTHDHEPDRLHWQIIMWEPDDPAYTTPLHEPEPEEVAA